MLSKIKETLKIEDLALVGLGAGLAFLAFRASKNVKKDKNSSHSQNNEKTTKRTENASPQIDFNDPEYEMIVREQLVRNYQFFGEEGQNKIRGSYVIIIGLGGVGR